MSSDSSGRSLPTRQSTEHLRNFTLSLHEVDFGFRIQRCAWFSIGHTYRRQSTEAFEKFHTDFFVEVDCGP